MASSDGIKIVQDDRFLLKDCCGIPVRCNNQQALELYNQGLLEFIKGYGDYNSKFKKSLELDSQFPLVNCTLVSCSYDVYLSRLHLDIMGVADDGL